MTEIPYHFDTPIPKYFSKMGFLKNPKNLAFLYWCFARCSSETREIAHDNQIIILKPYQFIFGRLICVEETGLTHNEVRTQQERWETGGLLKKSTNKTPNRFTIYEWSTERFLKDDHQQNHQPTTNRPPTNHHNLEEDISNDISKKEDAQPAAQLRSKDSLSFNFEKWEFEGITEKDISNWKLMYPHIDLTVETLKATEWLKNNPSKNKKTLWRKYLTGWFGRSNDAAHNKKAFRSAAASTGQDRRTKDRHGNPVDSPHTGRF